MDMLRHIIPKFETPMPHGKRMAQACAGPVFFDLTVYTHHFTLTCTDSNLEIRIYEGTATFLLRRFLFSKP